jgi:hypothetical protein
MTQPVRTHAAWRGLVVGIVVLSGVAANCQQCAQVVAPQRGNIDRVADVVLVNGPSSESPQQTYALMSNPELGFVRVLNLTTGQFVLAPNQYFPLSLPVGAHTTAMATPLDVSVTPAVVRDQLVFALDGVDNRIHVVCTPNTDCAGFDIRARVDAPPQAADIAAVTLSDDETMVVLSLPTTGQVAFASYAHGTGELARWSFVDLEGAQPTALVLDPLGESLLVADANAPVVHVLQVSSTGVERVDVLDVLSPIHAFAAGVVSLEDGEAPVVLALGAAPSSVSLLRLYRPGFREDRYAVLGVLELALVPEAGFVPDQRADGQAVVCCRGLSSDAAAAGEGSAAWGSVWLSDGNLLHVRLQTSGVRLFDDDIDPIAIPEGADWNNDERLWQSPEGVVSPRPSVQLVDWEQTPLVRTRVQSLSTLRLEYEAILPALNDVGVELNSATREVRSAAWRLSQAQVGDEVSLADDDGCTTITTIAALDDAGATLDAVDGSCTGVRVVRMRVRSKARFVVSNEEHFLGVVGDANAGAPALPVAERALEVRFDETAPVRGSTLSLPVDVNFVPFGLRLGDRTFNSYGQAALVPTAIAGGVMTVPGANRVPTLTRRVVLVGSGGDDLTRSLVLTFDEAETDIGRVDDIR